MYFLFLFLSNRVKVSIFSSSDLSRTFYLQLSTKEGRKSITHSHQNSKEILLKISLKRIGLKTRVKQKTQDKSNKWILNTRFRSFFDILYRKIWELQCHLFPLQKTVMIKRQDCNVLCKLMPDFLVCRRMKRSPTKSAWNRTFGGIIWTDTEGRSREIPNQRLERASFQQIHHHHCFSWTSTIIFIRNASTETESLSSSENNITLHSFWAWRRAHLSIKYNERRTQEKLEERNFPREGILFFRFLCIFAIFVMEGENKRQQRKQIRNK